MSSNIPAEFSGRRYHVYNDWVRRTHGGRVQKISIDAGFTCPNRDGTLGQGGCSFCNNEGFSPSYLREQPKMADQIATGVEFMRRRYPRTLKFLAYFQSYSNTYGDLPRLKAAYAEALALARELQQQGNWEQRATSWVNYIQAQTDGANKNAA